MNDLLFIAELSSNWFGKVDIAKYIMKEAKWAGATHIKMQFYPCDELYDKEWKWFKHAKLCELDYDTARILKEHAESIGLGWFCSVHTKEDIDFLVDVKAPFIKIKASQYDDYDLINYAHEKYNNSNVIVSLHHGESVQRWGDIQYLYTVSKYPMKWEDIQFGKIEGCSGFSDHTRGIQASLCAAMYSNITIFERHFTSFLNPDFQINESGTPDYCVSIYPHEFKEMVEKIKHIKGI